MFSLLLARLADDASDADDDTDSDSGDYESAEGSSESGRSISRDKLIKMLLDLPRKSEIDVQIGTEQVAITGVAPGGRKNWAVLQCHPTSSTSRERSVLLEEPRNGRAYSI